MPTSRHDPSDTLLPETPAEYAEPTPFRYPLALLFGVGAVIASLTAVLFGGLLWHAQGPAALARLFTFQETDTSVAFTVQSSAVVIVAVGAIGAITVVHELVHGIVLQRRGYRVSYGAAPQLGAFYAAAFYQFQTRDDNILAGIAPLAVLTALLVPALFVPNVYVAFAAFVALVFNTVGASSDLYLVGRLLLMPADTLLYDSDARHSFVYYPAS